MAAISNNIGMYLNNQVRFIGMDLSISDPIAYENLTIQRVVDMDLEIGRSIVEDLVIQRTIDMTLVD